MQLVTAHPVAYVPNATAQEVNALLAKLSATRADASKWDEQIQSFKISYESFADAYNTESTQLQIEIAESIVAACARISCGTVVRQQVAEHVYIWLCRASTNGVERERLAVLEQFHDRHAHDTFQARIVKALLAQAKTGGIVVRYQAGMTMEEALDAIQLERRRRLERLLGDKVEDLDAVEEAIFRAFEEEARCGHRRSEVAPERKGADSETMRSIYRALIRWLHPDREPDDALRGLKTAMMQKANLAYAQSDMGTLLLLRIEALQIPGLAESLDIKAEHLDEVLGQIETQIKAAKQSLTEAKRGLREWANERLPIAGRFSVKAFKAAMTDLQRTSSHNLEVMRRVRDDAAISGCKYDLQDILEAASDLMFN